MLKVYHGLKDGTSSINPMKHIRLKTNIEGGSHMARLPPSI